MSSKLILGTLLLCALSCVSCDQSEKKSAQTEKDRLNEAIEAKAVELVAEQQRKEQYAAEEGERIAVERAKLEQMAAEKREQIAADLSTREGTANARRMANLEIAATEMARRETAVAMVKEFVDSLEIRKSKINETVTLKINNETAKDDMMLISPAGYTLKYLKQDGDYYMFLYEDDSISLTLKRALQGVSFPVIVHKKPLAEGIPADATQPLAIPSSSSSLVPSGGLTILGARYGAETTTAISFVSIDYLRLKGKPLCARQSVAFAISYA